MTLAEALTAAGYGYRSSKFFQYREVYALATGEVVGQFLAHQAWGFLEGAR